MDTLVANEEIRQYLLDNYEAILEELLPLLDRREELLKEFPHLTMDIKDQFRWAFGSVIIHKLSVARPDISGEDISVYARSIDVDHFLTLQVKDVSKSP